MDKAPDIILFSLIKFFSYYLKLLKEVYITYCLFISCKLFTIELSQKYKLKFVFCISFKDKFGYKNFQIFFLKIAKILAFIFLLLILILVKRIKL